MVMFEVEPLRLEKIFESALPIKTLERCPIMFTPLNAQINYVSPSGNLIILAIFSESYFKEFECEEVEYLVVYPQLLKSLRFYPRWWTECVAFWTDSRFVYTEGEEYDDKVSIPLEQVKDEMKTSPFQAIITDEGLMPTLNGEVLPINVHALVAVEKLVRFLPKAKNKDDNEIVLVWDGEKFSMVLATGSEVRTRHLSPKQYSVKGEPIVAYFKRSDFLGVAKKFYGEVWLGLGNFGIVISQVSYEYKLTYVLRAEKVEMEE